MNLDITRYAQQLQYEDEKFSHKTHQWEKKITKPLLFLYLLML